jgi:hypothetical protein
MIFAFLGNPIFKLDFAFVVLRLLQGFLRLIHYMVPRVNIVAYLMNQLRSKVVIFHFIETT